MKELAEKLYEKAIKTAIEWGYGETAEEAFGSLFSKDADIWEHGDINNKFAAVFEAVVEQLIEETGEERLWSRLRVVGAAYPEARSEALLFDTDNHRVLHWFDVKHWHLWKDPEELKKDLVDIYQVVKKKLERKVHIAVADEKYGDLTIYEVPLSLVEKSEFSEEELERDGRPLFEMGESGWIDLPLFEWKDGKCVKYEGYLEESIDKGERQVRKKTSADSEPSL